VTDHLARVPGVHGICICPKGGIAAQALTRLLPLNVIIV